MTFILFFTYVMLQLNKQLQQSTETPNFIRSCQLDCDYAIPSQYHLFFAITHTCCTHMLVSFPLPSRKQPEEAFGNGSHILQWLPISIQLKSKVLAMAYRTLSNGASARLSQLIANILLVDHAVLLPWLACILQNMADELPVKCCALFSILVCTQLQGGSPPFMLCLNLPCKWKSGLHLPP